MHSYLRFAALLLLACAAARSQGEEGILLTVPNPLSVSATEDDPPQQQIFIGVTVSDPNCSAFRVIDPNAPWLTLSKTSGNAPDGVKATIDYSTFAANEERFTQVTFESLVTPPNETYCLDPVGEGVVIFRETLPITAKLLPGGPTAIPFPVPQLFDLTDTSGSQQPLIEFLDMTNSGQGSFNYVLEVSYSGSTQGWLTVTPANGTVSSSPVQHQVIANPVGLPSGTHRAVITVMHDAAGSPTITIPVTLTLSGPPQFSVTPLEITGTARRGKQNPAAVGVVVSNTGGGTLSYQIESSVEWVTVTPTEGQSASNAASSHSVVFDALDLPVGVQNATLTISTLTPGVTNNPVIIPVQITVEPGGTVSSAPPETRVIATAGSTEPQQVRIRVESPELDRLSWRAHVDPPNVQWLRLLESGGTLPSVVVAEVDATTVPRPVVVAAGVVIEAFEPPASEQSLSEEGANPGQTPDDIVRVSTTIRLQTILQDAELATAPERVELIARPGDSVKVQPIAVSMNGGAPALSWEASIEPRRGAEVNPIRIAPASGVGPGVMKVSADPAGLRPGVYDADVVIRAGEMAARTPVAFLVAAPGQSIVTTGQTAVTLEGSATGLQAHVPVTNLGAGATPSIQVRPSTLAGGNWLSILSTASEGFDLRASGVGLNTGVRHGMLEIVAPGASNTPQYLPVIYEREGPDVEPELALDRGGVVMTSVGGAAASAASFRVSTTSDAGLRALVGVSTETGVEWLSASPADTQISARGPVTVDVAADPTDLAPGVHRGRVTVGVPNGPMQSVAVTLVVAPAGPCTPRTVAIAPLAPPDGFEATVGRALTVEAGLIDDCGFPVRGGLTVGGAARGVLMRDMGPESFTPRGAEVFRGTMFPPAPGPVQIQMSAAATGLASSELRLSGAASSGSDGAENLSASPLVHAATFGLGRPLAPGSIATLFGTGFPSPAQQPMSLPLPETIEGFSVRVAGRPAPLFFLNSTQANLQIPVETPANTLVQSLVQIGDRYLPAETFLSSEAQPGVFALSENRAVVVNQDGTINSPSNPARPGQVVVAYLTGVGATLPASLTGQAAPATEPFARPALEASASIGGAPADILYLGLTPGFVGLAQANLRIAETAATGVDVSLVVDVGTHASPPLLLAVEP